MVKIINKTDNLFREIRNIKIYSAENYTFSDNMERKAISAEPILEINNIIPEDFERSIKPKISLQNRYYQIDISFYINSINPEKINQWNEMLNKKDFVVALYSNEECTIVGNDKEPISIDIIDNIKENNSGTDAVAVSIEGSTIISPWIYTI